MADPTALESEQAYVDFAYGCLAAARERAFALRRLTGTGKGGTHQARIESEVVEDTIRSRLAALQLGDDVALVFGRIDREPEPEADRGAERWYIGRVAVADERQEPVVVDWRAPVAEPFYRATGRSPLGLSRRRHFASKGRTLLGIEDESFGDGEVDTTGIVGQGALVAALGRARTGYLGDIVATIQAEQDEIIRSELGGVLVVQGGPGTGKTVVALHRAAYLLYTHRFPLEDQGLLVVGPNRLYLRYVERVLPSLDEAGVELVVLADLVPEEGVGEVREGPVAARVKGGLAMARVLSRAVRDRQRHLRDDLEIGFGLQTLRLGVDESERIVRDARRRSRTHNAGRRLVEASLWEALAASARQEVDADRVRDQLRSDDDVRVALEWMWPVLTPAQLLRDLFGAGSLLRSAGRGSLSDAQRDALRRPRGDAVEDVKWTDADVPLLDEARVLLGARPRRTSAPAPPGDDEIRMYGHIVVDEAQDLSPMQLRMLARRSLGGSMTIVGDLAQATAAFAPDSWDDIMSLLPSRKAHRVQELTIGYRTPAAVMSLANRVLEVAAPGLRPPRAVREGGDPPRIVRAGAGALLSTVAALVAEEQEVVGEGNVAVIVPDALLDAVHVALDAAGVAHGSAVTSGLDARVTIVPVRLVKGLELDAVVVVEPGRIVADEVQGMRSLYVALTRATRRLALVHEAPLPDAIAG